MSENRHTLGSMNDRPDAGRGAVLRTAEDHAQITIEDIRWVGACYLDAYAQDAHGVLAPTADGYAAAGTAIMPTSNDRDFGPASAAAAVARAAASRAQITGTFRKSWEPIHSLTIVISNPHGWKPIINWDAAARPLPPWLADVDEVRIHAYTAPSVTDPLDTRLPDDVRDELIFLAALHGGEVIRTPDDPTRLIHAWDLPGGGWYTEPLTWRELQPLDTPPAPVGQLINAVDRFRRGR